MARVAAALRAFRAASARALAAAVAAARFVTAAAARIATFLRLLANAAVAKLVRVLRDPGLLLAGLRARVTSGIERAPAAVGWALAPAATQLSAASPSGETGVGGVMRHVGYQWDYWQRHWPAVLIDSVATLAFPTLALVETLPGLWQDVRAGANDLWHGRRGDAVDRGLAAANAITGILGAFFATAGLVLVVLSVGLGPAGFAAAAEAYEQVGAALVAITFALLLTTALKGARTLILPGLTPQTRERTYGVIAAAGLGMAVMGALAILGPIAVRVGRALAAPGEQVRLAAERASNVEATGEPSLVRTGTSQSPRPREKPHRRPPDHRTLSPGDRISLDDLTPGRKYLVVVDEAGDVIVAPEDANLRDRLVKHGDLTPGVHGWYRGRARWGGELVSEQVEGRARWVLNNDSSYCFARMSPEGTRLAWSTPESLVAAARLLGTHGIDLSKLILRDKEGRPLWTGTTRT
jgi:hypothetical protein